MKKLAAFALLLALAGCSQSATVPAAADSPDGSPALSASPSPEREGREGRRGKRGKRYKKNFEEMDTDHDGKLSDTEKSTGFDKLVVKSERDRADKDKDGKISPEEKAEALKTFMKPREMR